MSKTIKIICNCPKCGTNFPMVIDPRFEVTCPECDAIARVDRTDLKEALEDPIERLPLLINSKNSLVQDIIKHRLKTESTPVFEVTVSARMK